MNEMIKWTIIKNITSLICFTILAVVFNHWWIVFFSIIFMLVGKDLNIRIEEKNMDEADEKGDKV